MTPYTCINYDKAGAEVGRHAWARAPVRARILIRIQYDIQATYQKKCTRHTSVRIPDQISKRADDQRLLQMSEQYGIRKNMLTAKSAWVKKIIRSVIADGPCIEINGRLKRGDFDRKFAEWLEFRSPDRIKVGNAFSKHLKHMASSASCGRVSARDSLDLESLSRYCPG